MYVTGADFSQHQGKVDWKNIKVGFAFIRATYGTYADVRFAENWPAAKAAGIPRGAYLYYYPTVDAGQQVRKYIDVVGGDWGELPPVIDVEEIKYGPVPKPWGPDLVAGLALVLDMVEAASGRRPLIYTNPGYWNAYLPGAGTLGCDLWVANWIKGGWTPEARPLLPAAWKTQGYKAWQFTSEGQCASISSKYLDLDICEESVLASLINPSIAQNPAPVPAAPAPLPPKFVTQPLSQRDPAWKDVTLGFGDASSTIGRYGCTLTCLTMVANGMGCSETPFTLDAKLRILGFGAGYTGDTKNLIVFPGLEKIFPFIRFAYYKRCRTVAAPMDVVDAALDAGNPVVVEVDFSPAAGLQNHWVLIYAREGDQYRIYDPWPVPAAGSELLSKYAHWPTEVAKEIIMTVVVYERKS